VAGRGLNDRQARFVVQFLVDFNATAAYRRAGYTARGNAAEACASRLLRHAKVRQALEVAMRQQQQRVELTADEVIEGLRREAADRGDGSSHSARVAALSWLGRHLAMFTDCHEHTFPDDAADRALDAELAQLAGRGAGAGAGPAADPAGPGGPVPDGRSNGRPVAE
jgi:Terminase small subunit